MRVLIAEDDPVSRRLLAAVLEKWGYEVMVTSDGLAALEVLKSAEAPRLAILDWMMPGMDGIQVCREVRKRHDAPYTYLLLLTARTGKDDIIEGMDAGADDYVTKPFDKSELQVRVKAGRRVLDLQSELMSAREALRNEATRDPLTGLPNRLLFADRLAQNIAEAHRANERLAVMFFDLDRFKIVNDTLGHSAGDMLLQQVAGRLMEVLRDVDTLARMGGDEFTMIVNGVQGVDAAEAVAQRALRTCSTPFVIEGQELFVTASVGISMFPSDGADVETLVRNADAAMYQAKENGRNSCHVYDNTLNESAVTRITFETDLRHALERDELVLYYQPRLSISTGEILGAEALLRWRHQTLGLVPPLEFVPLAEETGLIIAIGDWVLDEACKQNKYWQDAGYRAIDVAVNVSARQFKQHDLKQSVAKALESSGLDPTWLVMELTESTIMNDAHAAAILLQELRAMGVHLSIDDFGTGYSSLNHLKRFPIDSLKIDRSFIKDITTNPDDAAIAEAVIAMAHSMRMWVTAEGVESLEQLELLRDLDCDEMQGYFVSRPVPAEEFEQLLRNHRKWAVPRKLKAA